MEDDKALASIDIDLNIANRKELNEAYLSAFGAQIEHLMRMMFGRSGYPNIPVSVRGTGREVSAFAKTLARERSYMKAFNRHGLGDRRTFASKHRLNRAVENFEKATGLKWPLK